MEDNHIILVTGTSSGLGLATASSLLNQNFSVIGIDQRSTRIQNTAYTHLEMDLAQFDANLILNELTDRNWSGFIHCAGISQELRKEQKQDSISSTFEITPKEAALQ